MKKYIFLIFVVGLLFLAGCKKEEAQATETPEEPAANESKIIEVTEELPEVPEEWKGKKIKDIMGGGEENTTVSEENKTTVEESEKNSEGVYVVEMQKLSESMLFFPKELTIKVGDTVKWVNKLDYLNKTAKVTVYAHLNSLFRSPVLAYDESYEYTFMEQGVFTYSATPYTSRFEKGTITVE